MLHKLENDDDRRRQIFSYLSPHQLELILLPTEKCNFRCTYCYEDFKLGRMRPQVIEGVKALIAERVGDLKHLQISWFGGEPLVASDIVLDIAGYAKRLCDEVGVRFASNATTNGYLLSTDLLGRLCAVKVTDYQITIDGEAEDHDTTRVLASGKGTYDRIMGNLLAAKNSDLEFSIMLRLHITRQNIDGVERAYHSLRRTFGDDSRFRFFVKAIENLGGPASAKNSVPDRGDVDDVARRAGMLLADSESGSANEGEQYVCYAARPNSFVIRSDGSVAKCTVIFNSDGNKLGTLGRDGSLNVDITKLRRWMQGFETLDPRSLSCPVEGLKIW